MSSRTQSSAQTPNRDNQSIRAALAQLRLRLLDLTVRNRLLNFKHSTGKSLRFTEGDPAAIYNRLVEAPNRPTVKILPVPEPSRRDWVLRNGRISRPDIHEWAKQHRIPIGYELEQQSAITDLRALMYADDLSKHCRKIDREANLAIEETGANMLFLVLGFLEFPDRRDNDLTLSAPLISVPVIRQKSGERAGR